MAKFKVSEVATQKASLIRLAGLVEKASIDPSIVFAARAITRDCAARDDRCELQAIFDAVKTGDSRVAALKDGLRYVSDPRYADFFTSPQRLMEKCADGACAADCDEHTTLVAALAAAVGFKVGLRAYGRKRDNGYVHIYAVAALPKLAPKSAVGLDTTVPSSTVGWEPPAGNVMTAWID